MEGKKTVRHAGTTLQYIILSIRIKSQIDAAAAAAAAVAVAAVTVVVAAAAAAAAVSAVIVVVASNYKNACVAT